MAILLLAAALAGCGQKPIPLASAAAAAAPADSNTPVPAAGRTAQGSGEKEPAHADTQAVPTTQAAQAVHASAEYNLKQHVTYSGPRSQKKVALTFDDGPDTKYTEQILDILKKSNVVATFFVTGEHAAAHPEVMKHIVAGGHEIGNHSWDHTNLTTLSEAQMAEQIEKTDQTIQRFTGQLPTLVRPPYGALSKEVADYAEQSHRIVCWSVDTRDWEGISVERILDNVKKEVKPGSIILQHSAGGKKGNLSNTVTALPQVIRYLKEHGYELTTVTDLIQQG